jgi:DNA-binding CsgD family transcriptional regulator
MGGSTAASTATLSRVRVGRAVEIEAIRHAIELGAGGTPSFMVVLGESGIGKTTLLGMAVPHTVPAGAVVLAATGDEAERDLDYGVLGQFLRAAPLSPDERAAFAPDPGTDPLGAGARLLRSLDALELDVPLVLTLDDAHLADAASMQALTFAARRLQRDPVTLLVFGRPQLEASIPPGLLRLAERTAGVRQLSGFDVTDVRELLRRRFEGDVEWKVAERLTSHTRGHPLHTRVLLEQLEPQDLERDRPLPAPRTFSSLLAAQLAECADGDRRLAIALAVLEQPAELDTVGAVAGVDDPLEAACRLESAGLVRVDHRPGQTHVELAHSLIRAALLQDLADDQLIALHRVAAQVTSGAESLRHCVAASSGADAELESRLVEQAAVEQSRGARRVAGHLLLDAAAVSPDQRRRERHVLRAAHHHFTVGEPLGARFGGIEHFVDDAWRSYVLGRRAMSAGQFETARPLLERAWVQLATTPDADEVRFDIAELRAVIAISTLRSNDALMWAERASDASAGGTLPATLLCHGKALAGDLAGAAAMVDALLATDLPAGQRTDAHLGRGIVAVWANDLERAETELSTVLRSGGETLLQAVNARSYLAETYYRTGRLAEAADLAETTVALTDDAQTPWLGPLPLSVAAFALAAGGELDRARAAATMAAELAAMTGQAPAWIWAEHAAMRVADAAHDHVEVARVGDRIVANGWAALPEGVHHWRATYAQALVATGRIDDARAAADDLEAIAMSSADPSLHTDAARARCLVASADGDDGLARRVAEAALAMDPGDTQPLQRGRLELTAGSFLRRLGARTAAARALTAAHARFTAIGARPWLEQCDRELVACGLRPARRNDPPAPQQLTPQEGVIARLVAEGRSNKDVATELFISAKTVEHHLSRIYAKLGVRGRSHLAAMFADQRRIGDIPDAKGASPPPP